MRARRNRVGPDDVLHLELAEEPPVRPDRLLLRPVPEHGDTGTGLPVPVRLRGTRASADLGGLPAGLWEVCGPDGGGRTAPVRTEDPGLNLADRYGYIARPRSRDLRVLRTPDGRLRVQVAEVRPYAEVELVRSREETVAVRGELAFAARPPGRHRVRIVLRQRHVGTELACGALLDDGAFSAEIPLRPLADAHAEERGKNLWDPVLAGGPLNAELRLASRADDIAGKKQRIGFRPVRLPHGGRTMRITPYYTVHDDLSLAATALDRAEGAR
ncbi:hypothetical protein [Allonocardiopsis opalescens]|uniref:Uncharacterized protein n=1 Tax=Allonocardiopsis opalescens TaxID=1144618 RepID=A0A2T0QC80_9ACTN|nr:hypothetical protein [Allonocardiopsis opalescens]PRY01480.1 hypothetical protein CLV72_10162 [Allonocardiopsis opalescens]